MSQPNYLTGTERVDFLGYPQCVRLSNASTSVVLGHHLGGRILEYALHGRNALLVDPSQAGWIYGQGEAPTIGPSGGRFDVGPEQTIPRHPTLWLGPWTVDPTGERAARLTSQPDDATGVQLTRDFHLASGSSRLACTQTIRNVSRQTTRWCHWSRTFAAGGGIAIVPLTPGSRFPRSWVLYGPGPAINFRPEDPHVRRRGDFLEVTGPPQHPKLGFDSAAGWLAYLTRDGLLFVKRFPVYQDRVYNEVAALTISVWYPDPPTHPRVELEPIGPQEVLAPGESASFTEDWYLLPYPFPAPGEELDLDAVAALVSTLG